MSENILVTGGCGFIGSHIVRTLVKNNYDVTVLDSLEWGRKERLQDLNVEIVEGDIRDEELVHELVEGVDGVFHLAAHVGNRRSIENPYTDTDINVIGTLTLLEAAKKYDVSKFVHSSSAAIFGQVKHTPIKESHPTEPESPYGVSKLASEKHCLCYADINDLEVVSLRYFNVYGKGQRYDEYGNVIPIWTQRMLDGEELVIYGDGEQTRDFINVKDVARANLKAYESDEAVGPINIGTGKEVTINELSSIFESIDEFDVDIQYAPARDGEVRHSVADTNKAKKTLNFEPTIKLENGIREYVSWMESI